jgi:Kre9/KNH-like N-terminal Ig-like domain
MRFSSALVIATLSALASAQNPFTFTTLTSITAGTPFNITWAPSTGTVDTVTLLLRQGDPTHLATIATIACASPFPQKRRKGKRK